MEMEEKAKNECAREAKRSEEKREDKTRNLSFYEQQQQYLQQQQAQLLQAQNQPFPYESDEAMAKRLAAELNR